MHGAVDGEALSSRRPAPPLKWAGGKRWLVANHSDLLPQRPLRYFEPFLGSGAVFFSIDPCTAVLSDLNPELINVYRALKGNFALVERYLRGHQRAHSDQHYYRVRGEEPRSAAARAARTLYLNRTCWNGLYRVNRAGLFNVPRGTKSTVILPTDDFRIIADRLNESVTLAVSDFEPVIDTTGPGDFLFVDPPYTVAHNRNGFLKYNDRIFSWADQERLHASLVRARRRGVSILMTNADHTSIRQLYRGFTLRTVERPSVIAGDRTFRGRFRELIISA